MPLFDIPDSHLLNRVMSRYSAEDILTIKTALMSATTGFASVSIAGQSVQSHSLAELRKMLEEANGQLANDDPGKFMRFARTVPPGAG